MSCWALSKSYLCAGVPIEVSLTTKAKGLQKSEDGGMNYLSYKGRGGFHALVMTGVYTSYKDNPDGSKEAETYYEFRNSWKEGAEDEPDSSLLRIPASQACHLKYLQAVVTPHDYKRQEFLKSSKVKTAKNLWKHSEVIRAGTEMRQEAKRYHVPHTK